MLMEGNNYGTKQNLQKEGNYKTNKMIISKHISQINKRIMAKLACEN